MIIGLGTDLIEVDRIEKMVASGRKNLETIFTENEMAYCNSKARKAEHYAARFAAKEAVLKAMGTGWRNGIAFSEIEILNDDHGKPGVIFHGRAEQVCLSQQVRQVHLSLSHSKGNAIAVAILER